MSGSLASLPLPRLAPLVSLHRLVVRADFVSRAALEEARKNAKKRELLGDEMQTGEVAPKEETLMERIARRRREAATAGLRDETNFPSLGGAKASRKPASSSSKASPWDLSKVEIAEEELEAARAPKLEGEGDTGLGLKATLLPGTKPIETSEELDSALKAIAGVSDLVHRCVLPHASFYRRWGAAPTPPPSCRRQKNCHRPAHGCFAGRHAPPGVLLGGCRVCPGLGSSLPVAACGALSWL